MRDKKIVAAIFLSYLNLRKLGILYFVPLAVLFILIPILGYGYLSFHGAGENAFFLIFYDLQKFIPFFGCWWILFSLSDYAEGKASELIRTYKKTVLADFTFLFTWYLLHVMALFGGLGILVNNYWMDFPLILIQTAIFTSAAFFLLFATRTMLAPFLVILFYEIFAMLSNTGVMEYINLFSLSRVGRFSQLIWPYLPLFLVSIGLVFSGNLLYKRTK